MTDDADALRQKRIALIAQIAAERDTLAQQGAALRPAAQMIDKVGAGMRFIRQHPSVLVLPITILALWRPRRLLSFALRGYGVWRLVQMGRQRLRR